MTDHSSSTVVHFVRHGEVENPKGILYGRLPGFRLSENGWQMSKLAAESLAGRNVTQLWSSPLERAQETAEAFAEKFELTIQTDDRLVEPSNYFEGRNFNIDDGVLFRPSVWWQARNPFRPSWGEPYRSIAYRMRDVLEDVRKAAIGTEAVCVSHQLAIEVLRRSLQSRRLWHNPRRRLCTLASITSFIFDGETLVDIAYAEPAIDLVPAHLRASKRTP